MFKRSMSAILAVVLVLGGICTQSALALAGENETGEYTTEEYVTEGHTTEEDDADALTMQESVQYPAAPPPRLLCRPLHLW